MALPLFSRYRSSKFSETGCKDKFSLLSRKVIYERKIYSILQKGCFLAFYGALSQKIFWVKPPDCPVLFMQITMAVGLISIVKREHPLIYLSQKLMASLLELLSICVSLMPLNESLA